MKTQAGNPDLFETDYTRASLASRGLLQELKSTYQGTLPDLPGMNTPEKWDGLSKMADMPPHRRQRIERVAGILDRAGCLNGEIIDFGVGWGDIIPYLLNRKPGLRYTGVDFSTQCVESCRSRFAQLKFRVCGPAELETASADTFMAMEVLEHVEAKQVLGLLSEFSRILKPNGKLLITVPTFENLRHVTFPCADCGKIQNFIGHVRRYTPDLIKAELQLAGFEVVVESPLYEFYGWRGWIRQTAKTLLSWVGLADAPVPGGIVLLAHKK